MIVGYARTSTVDQEAGLNAQIKELERYGCQKVFSEQISSVSCSRRILEEAITFVREGDVFMVTRLDRLARSVQSLMEIEQRLRAKNVNLQILNIGLDTSTPTGKLMLTVLAAIAEFERDIMLERQKEGIAKAKAQGKYKGRAPLPQEVKDRIVELVNAGAKKTWVARKLGLGEATIYRVLSNAKKNQEAKKAQQK